MKVYVLLEKDYNYEGKDEINSFVISIHQNEENARKEMQEIINDNKQDFGFIEDGRNKIEKNHKIIFQAYQENWSNYIEFEIIKKEVL